VVRARTAFTHHVRRIDTVGSKAKGSEHGNPHEGGRGGVAKGGPMNPPTLTSSESLSQIQGRSRPPGNQLEAG
jgi:hypothetical protein